MTTGTYDAVVIGGGPGGYACAIHLAQHKLKVVCVEREEVGGVCLNWGCIPSKAIIQASHTYERAKRGATMGVIVDGVRVDAVALQTWKDGIVKKLTTGIKGLFRGNGVELLYGEARVTGATTVEVRGRDGTTQTLTATRGIVVATGAKTIEIPGFAFNGTTIIGAREAVSLNDVPKRLCVIGGGVIGLELGSAYQRLGSELAVVEALPTLLPGIDADCVAVVEKALVKHGAAIHKASKAIAATTEADGSLRVDIETDGKTASIACDVVLVAVGMRPNGAGLGLEEVGVKVERGFVPSDAEGRSNVPGIFSIGDVSGPPMLAHKATKEGEVVAAVIAGQKAAKDWVAIPGAVFTHPEIAVAGLTEADAKERGFEVRVGKFPFAALGRALAGGDTDGFIKVVADKKTNLLLGVHIVGPSATDLISEGVLALEMHAFLEDIGLTIHPHPTFGEGLMEASMGALGHAVHMLNR